ncbi:MAG: aminoacyl-tRNA hydrolase [Puniceicoccales bacterium]|jgi:PTH1 family peptidyl-tRNA hydrolase|nr:aminoacyl-tRNA hydrolase [Puniceicoccales bacterium]
MSCALLVGLGNPGKEYELTRHNIGFLLIDAFASRNNLRWTLNKRQEAEVLKYSAASGNVILAKPMTFMNESGTAVAKLCSYYKIPSGKVVIIYDDIAFALGDVRIHAREGTGGHNGIADILSKIGGGFVRFRVGIGEKPNRQMILSDYVLSKFSPEELQTLAEKTPKILEYLQLLLDKGIEDVMTLVR